MVLARPSEYLPVTRTYKGSVWETEPTNVVSDDFTRRMLKAINGMTLDMLAAIAKKDCEDTVAVLGCSALVVGVIISSS